MTKPHGFPKNERLKSRKLIEQLFCTGRSFRVDPLRVIFLFGPLDEPGGVEVGVSVGKRFFKKAADRNQLKRLMREAYRHQKCNFKQTLIATGKNMHVFFIYSSNTMIGFQEMAAAMEKCLNRLQKLASEDSQ